MTAFQKTFIALFLIGSLIAVAKSRAEYARTGRYTRDFGGLLIYAVWLAACGILLAAL